MRMVGGIRLNSWFCARRKISAGASQLEWVNS